MNSEKILLLTFLSIVLLLCAIPIVSYQNITGLQTGVFEINIYTYILIFIVIFLIIIFAIEIYILKLVKGELKDKRRIKKTSFFKRFKKFFRTSEKREKKETKEERKKRLEKRRKFITFARKEAVRRRNIKEALGIKAKVEKRQALEDKEEEKRARERKKKIEEWKKEAEQRRKEAERKSKQNKRFEKLREKMGLKKKPSEFALRTRRIVDLMRK